VIEVYSYTFQPMMRFLIGLWLFIPPPLPEGERGGLVFLIGGIL
jgi:hypothetical protein